MSAPRYVLTMFDSGTQAGGTGKYYWVCPRNGRVVDIRASEVSGPLTSTGDTFDVMKNGTTLYTGTTGRPFIAFVGSGAGTSTTTLPAVTTIAAGDILRLDCISVSGGTAGAGLQLSITIEEEH